MSQRLQYWSYDAFMYNMSRGGPEDSLAVIDAAWGKIISGVMGHDLSALDSARSTLAHMDIPAAPQEAYSYGAGQLALAQLPIFDAWAANRDVTRDDLDVVQRTIVRGDLSNREKTHSSIVNQGAASVLMDRAAEPDEPVVNITYAAPWAMSIYDYVDAVGRGPRHLHTQIYAGADPVPIRLIGTKNRGTYTHFGHIEQKNVLAFGLGRLLIDLAKNVDGLESFVNIDHTPKGWQAAVDEAIRLLRREERVKAVTDPERNFLNLATNTLRALATDYQQHWNVPKAPVERRD